MRDIESIAIDEQSPDRVMMDAEEGDLVLPANGYFDWTAIRAIGDFAAHDPRRWKTIAAKLSDRRATQAQIARRLGINQATVARHLQYLKIGGLE